MAWNEPFHGGYDLLNLSMIDDMNKSRAPEHTYASCGT
jgi:hypothetical protein